MTSLQAYVNPHALDPQVALESRQDAAAEKARMDQELARAEGELERCRESIAHAHVQVLSKASSSPLLLSSLELSHTKVYDPLIRALLGTKLA